MTDIAELVRMLREDIPEPELGSAADTARVARERARVRSGSRRSRPGRLVVGAVGGLASAGVLGVLGYLFVATPSEPGRTEGARVDWGMTATVRVVAYPGTSASAATAQARSAILARGREQDIQGLVVKTAGSNRLQLTVPAATREQQITQLVSFTALAIYDEGTAVVARASRLSGLQAAVDAASRRGIPPAGFAFDVGNSWSSRLFPTRAAAQKATRDMRSKRAEILAVPRGFSLVNGSSFGPRWSLLRGAPLLTSGDISAVRARGTSVAFELRPGARARWGSRSNGRLVAVDESLGTGRAGGRPAIGTIAGRSTGTASADNVVVDLGSRGSVESYAREFGAAGVGGRLEVESSRRYGQLPPVQGDSVELPDLVREVADGKPIVRVVAGNAGGVDVQLWVYQVGPGSSYLIDAGEASGLAGGSPCDVPLGAAALRACGGSIGPDSFLSVGRVGPEVATVDASLAGRTAPVLVRNGWFVAAMAPRTPTDSSATPARSLPHPEIVARDSNGRVVGEINRLGLFERPR